MSPQERAIAAVASLNPCEREVASMLASGMAIKQVAHERNRTYCCVEAQRLSIYRKLGIKKAAQLAVICTLAGLVTDWREVA